MAYTPTTFSPERLYQGQPGTTETTLYTAPSNCQRVIVKEIIIANTSNSSATISLSIVPAGGTAGNSNRIIPSTVVSGNSFVKMDQMSEVLYLNDFISAIQGTSGAITVTISGVVIQ